MKLKAFAAGIIIMCGIMLFTGCISGYSNNHLELPDVVEHFRSSGLNVTQVTPVDQTVFHSMRGCAVQFDDVEDQEIGIYKYDLSNKKMKATLDNYALKKYAMCNGLKYPVVICGSFMLIGVEKNPHREAIIESLKSFK